MAGPKNLNSDFLYPTYFKLDFIDVMIVFWHSNVILFDVLQKSDWENFSLAINGPQNDFKRGLEIPICKVPTLRPNKGTMRFCILDIFGGTRISCKLGQINQKKMQRRAPGWTDYVAPSWEVKMLGMPPFQKSAVFLNIVQKAFDPPPFYLNICPILQGVFFEQ